jgi:hypothetical protein
MALMAVGTALMFAAIDGVLSDGSLSTTETLRQRVLVGAESEAWTTFRGLSASVLRAAPVGRVSATTRTVGDMELIASVDKVDTSFVWIVAVATIRRSTSVARHRVGLSAIIPADSADLTLRPVPERAWAELF